MLSILIPIYNFEVYNLVEALQQQGGALGLDFEIRCYDDASAEKFQLRNRSIRQLEAVVYQEFNENQGRSRIRNLLAESARYDYLLFMDCDSAVVRSDYLEEYLKHLNASSILYGGRSYSSDKPSLNYIFHWTYGIEREVQTSKQRQLKPYKSFMTNNFLIPRDIYQSIGLDERLKQYGHEDTLFGLELEAKKIPIIHLDNPLEHIGLESVDIFLGKTKHGIENLFFLAQSNSRIDTKLLRVYKKLKYYNLVGIISRCLNLLRPFLLSNLRSRNPKMFNFDLYKLGLLIEESKNYNRNK